MQRLLSGWRQCVGPQMPWGLQTSADPSVLGSWAEPGRGFGLVTGGLDADGARAAEALVAAAARALTAAVGREQAAVLPAAGLPRAPRPPCGPAPGCCRAACGRAS